MLGERGLSLIPIGPAGEIPASEIAAQGRAVLCFGPGSSPDGVKAALDALEREAPQAVCLSLVLTGASNLERFQELINEDRLFYLAQGVLSERDMAGLLESAAGTIERQAQPAALRGASSLSLPVDTLRRFALARSLPEMADAMKAALTQAVGAQRGRCMLFDPQSQVLWNPEEGDEPQFGERSGESPAVGLTSFVLRTGLTLCLPRAGDDPRFDPDLDDPDGDPADRFLGAPVRSGEGEVVAVLTAVRPAQEPPFEPRDVAALESLAAQAAPYLLALAPAGTASTAAQSGPFRERALRERDLSSTPLEPLRLTPGWTRWVYWLALGALITALIAVVVVRIPEYASGVAVVRAGGRIEVTANAGGTVSSLAVAPRDRVREGQLLLTLYNAEEASSLKRLDREMELKLVQRLQSPSDPVVAQDLMSLRAEQELARARLSERELRAPADGEIGDIRVAPGQLVQAGQPVLSILSRPESSSTPSVVALLPGHYLPQLRPGMRMRLELPGHPYVYQWLVLDSAAAEVIGPAEARRLLGPVAGDAVPLDGPLAVVTAPLSSPTFEVAGQTYAFRDGMPSRAEVRVRSERLLFALLPALKSLGGRRDG